MLSTYQCIISPRAPWGWELTAFQPNIYLLSNCTYTNPPLFWGARALGGQVYSEYIGGEPTASAQSHLEVLPQNYSIHISQDVPKFLLSASKPGMACKVSIMFSLSPLVHFTFMSCQITAPQGMDLTTRPQPQRARISVSIFFRQSGSEEPELWK